MKKKRILFFAEGLYGGGVERILQIIFRNFDYTNYDVTLYTVCKQNIGEPFSQHQIRYRYIYDSANLNQFGNILIKIKNKTKLWVYRNCSAKLFYKIFIREKPDVAIAFIEGYATKFVSGFPNNTKKIAWLHTDIINNPWSSVAYSSKQEERDCYRLFDKVVCVSKIVQSNYETYLQNINNSLVLYNPIDCLYIRKHALKTTQCYKSPSTINITSFGSLIPVKGYERLIKVFAKLKAAYPYIVLHIYGEGYMCDYLNSLIKELNLSDCVFLDGFKQNPYPYLKSADIYVCSSFAEGYNTAISEALILGKPVVSTECSGVKEQLGDNNEWGICCENSDKGLYEGITEMLSKNKLVYYAKQAELRGKDFSLEASMTQIYKIINL